MKAWAKGDRGSVSVWVVLFAVLTIVLLALLVDGGQAMLEKVRVADIAEQGARAAADDVNTADLRADGTVTLGPGYCNAAKTIVNSYASSAQLGAATTQCSVPADPPANVPELVSVTVSVRFQPMLSLIFPSFMVTSTESATVFCGGYDQQEKC
jgi:Flp pilus assembly protein TadG